MRALLPLLCIFAILAGADRIAQAIERKAAAIDETKCAAPAAKDDQHGAR